MLRIALSVVHSRSAEVQHSCRKMRLWKGRLNHQGLQWFLESVMSSWENTREKSCTVYLGWYILLGKLQVITKNSGEHTRSNSSLFLHLVHSWALLTSTWRSLPVQAPPCAAVYWRATTPRTLGRTIPFWRCVRETRWESEPKTRSAAMPAACV